MKREAQEDIVGRQQGQKENGLVLGRRKKANANFLVNGG